jgi:hypothetical protein
MIVDESSNTVYNPVTNTTLNYTDYAYDYLDRSYNLTLEDGSTMKVTYGDENVTINEGDTVYNIYYIVPEADQEDDGSGSGGYGGVDGAVAVELSAFHGYKAAAGGDLAAVVGEGSERLGSCAGHGGFGEHGKEFSAVHDGLFPGLNLTGGYFCVEACVCCSARYFS